MSVGDKIIDAAKEQAIKAGGKVVDVVKERAISELKGKAIDAGLEGLKNSLSDQLNIDGAINEIQKQLDIGNIAELNNIPNELQSEFNTNSISSEIDINNIFGNIDFSELEAQGVDTSEIKKMLSDAQSEINSMSIDTSQFGSLDAKSLGLNFDVKSVFSGSTSDIKTNIQKVLSQIKNPQNIDAVKTINDVASSMKTQMPASVKASISEAKSQVSSMTSQIQSTMRSMGSSFGGFRR